MLKQKKADFLLNLGCLDNIVISIDGTKETHNRLRGAIVYDQVIQNVEYLITKRNKCKKNITIRINTVVTRDNINELCTHITTLDNIGIDEWVGLQLVGDSDAQKSQEYTFDELLNLLKTLGEIDTKTKCSIVPKITQPLLVDYINKKYNYSLKIPIHTCGAGLSFGYIDWKGYIFPCDRAKNNDTTSAFYRANNLSGVNLLDSNLKDSVSTELFKKFSFIYDKSDKELSRNCKKCNFYQKECTPCPIDRKFSNKIKNAHSDCERLFALEKERLKTEIIASYDNKQNVLFMKHITYNTDYIPFNLFDHENNKIYQIDDINFISLLAILQPYKNGLSMKELLLQWIDYLSSEKSFVNSSVDETVRSFEDVINYLLSKCVIVLH
ncbi:MAG: hypothetical protein Ta2B_09910 [Termitinemataceae bacterium]|nr:MAG: hypothetical protein Ta2B_09910 [Termitinemataceae bacterium]